MTRAQNFGESGPPLWACHGCRMIGDELQARVHGEITGHSVEEISQEESDEIREMWREQQAQRVVGLMAAASQRRATERSEERTDG